MAFHAVSLNCDDDLVSVLAYTLSSTLTSATRGGHCDVPGTRVPQLELGVKHLLPLDLAAS